MRHRHIRRASVDSSKLSFARSLRRAPTPAESVAWNLLRDRRMLGLKFRRQQLVLGFVVDFYCAELRLALELDGGIHADPDQAAADALRTRALAMLSIQVHRVPNEHVDALVLRRLLAPLLPRHRSRR
jgi:very-short-patch-repair endonuclease